MEKKSNTRKHVLSLYIFFEIMYFFFIYCSYRNRVIPILMGLNLFFCGGRGLNPDLAYIIHSS